MEWSPDALKRIVEADDLHIAPLREDGATYGTPTWICRWRSMAASMSALTTA